jgi:tRNA1(Val) A37 N6-methylase TrmN6
MNPPFNDVTRHRLSPDEARATAHGAVADTLTNWVDAARRVLRSGGALTLIWRADGLAEVLAALGRGFGSLSLLPVHGDASKPAIRIIVRAVKGGRAPTRMHAGLMLNGGEALSDQGVGEIMAGKRLLPPAIP